MKPLNQHSGMSGGGWSLAAEYNPGALVPPGLPVMPVARCSCAQRGSSCRLQTKVCFVQKQRRGNRAAAWTQLAQTEPRSCHGAMIPAIPHSVTPRDGGVCLAASSLDLQGLQRDSGASIAATGCCPGCTGKDRAPQQSLSLGSSKVPALLWGLGTAGSSG